MGKYIHKYNSLSAFTEDYEDESVLLVVSFVCSAGTFTYDTYEAGIQAYVWVNAQKTLWTPDRNPKVGAFDYPNGTGAYDPDNDNGVEITLINTEQHEGKYLEPWVSATKYEQITKISGDWWFAKESGNYSIKDGTVELEYIGEVYWRPTMC